jgi:hypothetical protein
MTKYSKNSPILISSNMLIALTIITIIVAAVGLKSYSNTVMPERPTNPRQRFNGKFNQERETPACLRHTSSSIASRRR